MKLLTPHAALGLLWCAWAALCQAVADDLDGACAVGEVCGRRDADEDVSTGVLMQRTTEKLKQSEHPGAFGIYEPPFEAIAEMMGPNETATRSPLPQVVVMPDEVFIDGANRSFVSALTDQLFDPPVSMSANRFTPTCNADFNAQHMDPLEGHCPTECGFLVEQPAADDFCHFMCVGRDQCAAHGLPYASEEIGSCAQCPEYGCVKCTPYKDATSDGTCTECGPGFVLVEKKCHGLHEFYWFVFFVILAIILLCVLLWYLDLICRPTCGQAYVVYGEDYIERSLLNQEGEGDSTGAPSADLTDSAPEVVAPRGPQQVQTATEKSLVPLSTNLLSTIVAGPGCLLFFQTQLYYILFWSVALAFWYVLVMITDQNLFSLGARPYVNKAELCALINWGFHEREHTISVTAFYMLVIYIGLSVSNFGHSVAQRRRYLAGKDAAENIDVFTALLDGLPSDVSQLGGTTGLERRLADEIAARTQQPVVGVSICWDYQDCVDSVEKLNYHSLRVMEDGDVGSEYVHEIEEEERQHGAFRRQMDKLSTLLVPSIDESDELHLSSGEIHTLLTSLRPSGQAYVVFETHASCIAAIGQGTVSVLGYECTLTEVKHEPQDVIWSSFAEKPVNLTLQMAKGIAYITLGLAIWAFFLYVPYTYFVLSYRGQSPVAQRDLTMTFAIVIGNQMIYALCRSVATSIGFRHVEDVEMTYLAFYSVAVFANLLLDLVCNYLTTMSWLEQNGVRTVHGALLSELSFVDGFESYPMQKQLGGVVFHYAFPSCFFIPFLVEPALLFLFRHLTRALVSARKTLSRAAVESSFTPPDMDLGRYGDIWLNVMLVCVQLWLPAGYYAQIILAFIGTHMFAFAWDHYRILRCTKAFEIHGDTCDRMVSVMNGFPCAMLGAGAVYKYHLKDNGHGIDGVNGGNVWILCFLVGFAHMVIHSCVVRYVIPSIFSNMEASVKETKRSYTYQEVAVRQPENFFTLNPVHTLRSIYLHKDTPPCVLSVKTKDHLQRANPALGCVYESNVNLAPFMTVFTRKTSSRNRLETAGSD